MSKSITTLTLHIIQPEDTLESIAKKYQTTVEEIKSLNISLRMNKLTIGMPINVKDNRERKIEIDFNDDNQKKYLLSDSAYLTKELILSNIFFNKGENYIRQSRDKIIENLIKEYKIANIKLKEIIIDLHNLVIDFISLLQSKNYDNIKSNSDKIDNSIDELEKILSSEFSIKSIKYLIKNFIKHWQLYILKVLTLDFENSERIFDDILQKYRLLTIKKPSA